MLVVLPKIPPTEIMNDGTIGAFGMVVPGVKVDVFLDGVQRFKGRLAAELLRKGHGHHHEPRRRFVAHTNNDIGHEKTWFRVEDRLAAVRIAKIPGRITETQ